jgi:hypothetical protein
VRDFWVREGCEWQFERIFGPEGIWPEFLKRSRQYLGSMLHLQSQAERRFRLQDYWISHLGFEAFRRIHQLDCDKLEQFIRREELVLREELLGAFYIDDPELGEGDELVPS